MSSMMFTSAALLALATPAILAQAGPHVLVAGPTEARALSYGAEAGQRAMLHTRGKARAPLIVYVHGGGWSAGSPGMGARGGQPDHITARGYAYATLGYRLVPAATVEQQLADLASGIALLRRQPSVDPARIVLVGHSSGGHLAALLGTDPRAFEAARIPFAALRAVVLLDPSVFDVAAALSGPGGATIDRYFRPAFGTDPARQSDLSPVKHAEAPNAPAWAILHDAANPYIATESARFAAMLRGAGVRVAKVVPIAGTGHMRLNNEIGAPDDAATAAIDAFLAQAMPETRRPRLR